MKNVNNRKALANKGKQKLFKKQEELMKPIHNQIFNIIQEIAKQDGYDFVFDRSGDLIFLYAKEEHDLTNKVLSKLQ